MGGSQDRVMLMVSLLADGSEQYSPFSCGGIGAKGERIDGDMHVREQCLTRRTTATVLDRIVY